MLAIGFAALLGLVLGRFLRVAILVPVVVATTAISALVEGASGAGAAPILAVAAIAAGCLQLAYLVSASTVHPHGRRRRRPDAFDAPAPNSSRPAR